MLKPIEEVKVSVSYTRFVAGSELLGFIPVENHDVCWYGIRQENAENSFVIAAFSIEPNRVTEIYSASKKAMVKVAHPEFIFETEKAVLEGKDKEAKKAMEKHIADNPFVLAFRGGNRDKGMRFKNRSEAMDFINLFTYFDEVMDEPDLQDNC